MALLVAVLTLSTLSWVLPLAVAAPDLSKLVRGAILAGWHVAARGAAGGGRRAAESG